MKTVLVLCTGNSCRSQMAEGYLRVFSEGRLDAMSAGLETHGVNPRAIQAMKEDGVDISNHTSNSMEEYTDRQFDYILTVCDHASEHCPAFPGNAIRLHQNFPDPAKASGSEEEINEAFRQTRDLIKAWCHDFVHSVLNHEKLPG